VRNCYDSTKLQRALSYLLLPCAHSLLTNIDFFMKISWTYIEVDMIVLWVTSKVVWIVEKTVAIELKYIDIRNINYIGFLVKLREFIIDWKSSTIFSIANRYKLSQSVLFRTSWMQDRVICEEDSEYSISINISYDSVLVNCVVNWVDVSWLVIDVW
jgi:hypothetical protein